jgi:hypothetical protein
MAEAISRVSVFGMVQIFSEFFILCLRLDFCVWIFVFGFLCLDFCVWIVFRNTEQLKKCRCLLIEHLKTVKKVSFGKQLSENHIFWAVFCLKRMHQELKMIQLVLTIFVCMFDLKMN